MKNSNIVINPNTGEQVEKVYATCPFSSKQINITPILWLLHERMEGIDHAPCNMAGIVDAVTKYATAPHRIKKEYALAFTDAIDTLSHIRTLLDLTRRDANWLP